jgi:hypothetical protein
MTLNTHRIIIKNKLAELFVRGRVKKNTLKNKTAEVFVVRDKAEEIDVKKQNAGDADTHHPQEHPREQLSQGGHCERQVCADQCAPPDRQ